MNPGLQRTRKQKIIVGIILRQAGQGMFHTIKELHALLPYTCAYGSFRRSIDFLEKHQIITKERAGLGVLVKPTTEAYDKFSPDN